MNDEMRWSLDNQQYQVRVPRRTGFSTGTQTFLLHGARQLKIKRTETKPKQGTQEVHWQREQTTNNGRLCVPTNRGSRGILLRVMCYLSTIDRLTLFQKHLRLSLRRVPAFARYCELVTQSAHKLCDTSYSKLSNFKLTEGITDIDPPVIFGSLNRTAA
ncbi:hypothetical protein BDR04DRAFT_1118237 [Suillus decipiens]|nr:hypothetical protein BDR04DRAFT_1118237 [Suillus decipiens]